MVPEDCAALPLAQTIWYIPTGLDIWNQKILKAPGHYARAPGWSMPPGPPPMPEVVWPDQQPERLEGPLQERLDHWMTLVHRGQVLDAYRVFLGLMENPAERKAGAGAARPCRADGRAGPRPLQPLLHDRPQGVPRPRHDRSRQSRSAGTTRTTSSMPARSTSRSARAGTRPTRWPATSSKSSSKSRRSRRSPMAAPRPRSWRSSPTTRSRCRARRREALERAIIREPEPGFLEAAVRISAAGKSPRRILDALQIASAQVILETQGVRTISRCRSTASST